MRASTLAWPIVCASLLLTAGCGFHLRGSNPLAPRLKPIYLQGISPYSKLGIGLKRRLEANGIRVVSNPAKAGAILTVTYNRLQREVLSVGAVGKVREYALSYVLRFKVTSADGEVLLPSQQVRLIRRYLFDRRSLLSAGQQAAMLRKVLIDKMVQRIMWRLRAI